MPKCGDGFIRLEPLSIPDLSWGSDGGEAVLLGLPVVFHPERRCEKGFLPFSAAGGVQLPLCYEDMGVGRTVPRWSGALLGRDPIQYALSALMPVSKESVPVWVIQRIGRTRVWVLNPANFRLFSAVVRACGCEPVEYIVGNPFDFEGTGL